MLQVSLSNVRFSGFPTGAPAFLADLAANNRREWFAEHRQEYEELLLAPARRLVEDLGPQLRRRVAAGLRVEPRVGGSILRIQRDARFSPGVPFKTHLELWFWEGPGHSRQHPGFFTRISADRLTVGAGIRALPPPLLLRFREAVAHTGSGVELTRHLAKLEAAGWQTGGKTLRRVPAPFTADHPRAVLFLHTGLWTESIGPLPDTLFGPELGPLLLDAFRRLRPLHRWLVGLDADP